MTTPKFNLKTMPLNAVKLWKDNPRRNDKSAEKLAEILKVHGVQTPIVVWEKDMTVYKGNTTVKACKLAGIKEVPVILAQFKDHAAAVSYALADNKSSEWSEWDDQILKRLLESKELIGTPMVTATGFTEKELNALKALEVHAFDDLPNVDLKGDSQEAGNFIVIRFGSPKIYNKVSSVLGLTKGKRVVKWEEISKFFQEV